MIKLSKILKEIEIKPEFITNPRQLVIGKEYNVLGFGSNYDHWLEMKYMGKLETYNNNHVFRYENGPTSWEMNDNYIQQKMKRREIKYV